jgi:hypothetical protein
MYTHVSNYICTYIGLDIHADQTLDVELFEAVVFAFLACENTRIIVITHSYIYIHTHTHTQTQNTDTHPHIHTLM